MIKHAEDLASYEPNPPTIFADQWSEFLHRLLQCILISKSPTVSPCETLDIEVLKRHLQRYGYEKHLDIFEQYFTDSNMSG